MTMQHVKKTPKLLARIRQLRRQGETYKAIGAAIGIHKTTVADWLGKSNRGRNPFRPNDRDLPAVPVDTRDMTGRMLGDPLPGRSALDKKRGIS